MSELAQQLLKPLHGMQSIHMSVMQQLVETKCLLLLSWQAREAMFDRLCVATFLDVLRFVVCVLRLLFADLHSSSRRSVNSLGECTYAVQNPIMPCTLQQTI